jgi:methylated-DNA-[protein]-cysteine S-methyltransferase
MRKTIGFSFFSTAIGDCGIAWGEGGITGVQLPDTQGIVYTRARMAKSFAQASEKSPPPFVQDAISRIADLMCGGQDDLRSITLDMSGIPAFNQRVYQVTRDILPGQTLTYGQVAAKLGEPGAARAVGQSLGRNPFAPVVPCHRVLATGASLGGFSASGGVAAKLRMLQIEGALPAPQPGLFDDAKQPGSFSDPALS